MVRFVRTRLRGAVLRGAVLAATLAVVAAPAAQAASLHIGEYHRTDLAGAQAAHAAFVGGQDLAVYGPGARFGAGGRVEQHLTETFAGHQAWNGSTGTTNPVTAVGRLSSVGGRGTGGSAINGGTGIEVRNDSPFKWGRHSVLAPQTGSWADSNDTRGIRWEASGPFRFNALSFYLTDAVDVGAKMSIVVGGTLYQHVLGADGRKPNGTIHWVRILLDELVDSIVVEVRQNIRNDGFGMSGMTLAHIAPIPVPPALALMLTGGLALFGLGAAARRRAA